MKVLHCIPGMGGGGAERQLAYLAAPLTACGWSVDVALGTGGPNLARLTAGGAAVHRLRAAGNHDPRLAWQLVRLIRRVRPDVVQVWFVQMDVLGGIAAEVAGTPWVMSERSSEQAYPASLKNRARVFLARRADAIVSNSSAGEAYWRTRAPRVPRFVIPNALPLDEIDATSASVPADVPVSSDDSVVLFAGRFGPEKNVGTLVTALREVVKRPRTVAVLCGDGPLRYRLRAEIAAAHLADRILTPGYIADLWPLMKRADVIVSIGLFEGHPNTVLEGMASARPLVVSDIPAHRAVLDDRSAFWVDHRDAAGVARTLICALDHPDEAAARAAAARSRIATSSIDHAAAQYDRVYRGVLAKRSSTRAEGAL